MYQNCWLQASEIVEKKYPPILGLNNLNPSPSHETSWSAADHPTSGCAAVFPDEPGTGNSWYSTILQERNATEMPKKSVFSIPDPKKSSRSTGSPERSSTRPCLDASLLTCSWLNGGYASWKCGWHVCENGGSDPQMASSLGDDWGSWSTVMKLLLHDIVRQTLILTSAETLVRLRKKTPPLTLQQNQKRCQTDLGNTSIPGRNRSWWTTNK